MTIRKTLSVVRLLATVLVCAAAGAVACAITMRVMSGDYHWGLAFAIGGSTGAGIELVSWWPRREPDWVEPAVAQTTPPSAST
jgi:hypothetical protein